jgi:L-ascorbate metabolism protein UlaG (beta-lactamase superfamily)
MIRLPGLFRGVINQGKYLIYTMKTQVEWLGHCAFRIVSSTGTKILIDPFDETIGLRVSYYECDILLISHSHYDSSARHLVQPGFEEISGSGEFNIRGVKIKAFQTYHDDRLGKDYGTVLVFVIELDGMKFGYLSHIGARPKQAILDELKNLDVCFIPVGGVLVLDPNEAKQLIEELQPGYIIPMHFNDRDLNFTLLGIGEFAKAMLDIASIEEIKGWVVEIDKESIPKSPTVVMMQHWPCKAEFRANFRHF